MLARNFNHSQPFKGSIYSDFFAIMIIKEHNSSTALVQSDPVMKFNHLLPIKGESLTFWWSHRSVIWCKSSREESEAGVMCRPRPLSCGWQSLSSSISSNCFLLLPVLLFFPGETENETVRCENWSRRDIPVRARQVLPYGGGEGGKCVSVGRSMVDRYPPDNLTSTFNSTCPHLCFVSWLLIRRMPLWSWPAVGELNGTWHYRLKHV